MLPQSTAQPNVDDRYSRRLLAAPGEPVFRSRSIWAGATTLIGQSRIRSVDPGLRGRSECRTSSRCRSEPSPEWRHGRSRTPRGPPWGRSETAPGLPARSMARFRRPVCGINVAACVSSTASGSSASSAVMRRTTASVSSDPNNLARSQLRAMPGFVPVARTTSRSH